MAFLNRVFSLGQHVFHAVAASETVQRLQGAGAVMLETAARVVEATLPPPPLEIPEDHPKRPLQQITDPEITDRVARLQRNIDDSIVALGEPKRRIVNEIENAQREEAPRPISTSSTALTHLIAKEDLALGEIKKHIFHFAGICIFDQGVLGNKQENTINFYKKYALNRDYRDATEAYLDDLYKQNRALFFIAKICIPIIHWFVGLFLTPGNHTSIPYLYAKLKTYFSTPANIKTFLLEELKVGQEYFAELGVHYENYSKERHPDQWGERAKTAITDKPESYIADKLEADMKKRLKGGKELLYERFNAHLFELLQVRTGGLGIIDAVANRILKHVIRKLSPAKMVLNSITTGTGSIDPTFGWNILELVKTKIIDPAKAAVEKIDTTLPLHTRISQKTLVDTLFSQDEQGIVHQFVKAFIDYLPLELVDSGTNRAGYHPDSNWLQGYKASLIDGATKMLLELAAEFINQFEANESKRLNFRLQVYDFIVGALFKTPPLTHDDAAYKDKKGQVKQALNELVNQGLKVSFQTEFFRAEREKKFLKVACSIATLKHDLNALREKLQISLENAIQTEDLERLEKENLALLAKLRQGMTQISIYMQDFLAFKGKSQATELLIKNQMIELLTICEAIFKEHLEIQKQIEQLRSCILPEQRELEALIAENNDLRINAYFQRNIPTFSKATARCITTCKKQSDKVCRLQREMQEIKERIHQQKQTLGEYEQALHHIESFHNRPKNIRPALEHLLELRNNLGSKHPRNFAQFEQQLRQDLAFFDHDQRDVIAAREKLVAILQKITELAALERIDPAQLDLSLQSEVVRKKDTYRKRLLEMIDAYSRLLGELGINDNRDQEAFLRLAPADLRDIDNPETIPSLTQRIAECKKQLDQKIIHETYLLHFLRNARIQLSSLLQTLKASIQRDFEKALENIHQANNRIKEHLQQMQKETEEIRAQPLSSLLPPIVERIMAWWEKKGIGAEISALKEPTMRFLDRVSHVEQLALRSHACLAEIAK